MREKALSLLLTGQMKVFLKSSKSNLCVTLMNFIVNICCDSLCHLTYYIIEGIPDIYKNSYWKSLAYNNVRQKYRRLHQRCHFMKKMKRNHQISKILMVPIYHPSEI